MIVLTALSYWSILDLRAASPPKIAAKIFVSTMTLSTPLPSICERIQPGQQCPHGLSKCRQSPLHHSPLLALYDQRQLPERRQDDAQILHHQFEIPAVAAAVF